MVRRRDVAPIAGARALAVAVAAVVLVASGWLVLRVPSARADALSEVQRVFSTSGQIPPCTFTSPVLEAALREAPTYDVEYSGISQAIDDALSKRAAGECERDRDRLFTGGAVPRSLRGLQAPGSVTAPGDGPIPLPLLLALGLAGACAVLLAGVGLGRARGWDPRWAQVTRHAFGEAEFRVGLGWEDLRDRLSERRHH